MKEGYTLITGASKGIGLELTKIFAKNHHNLILVARSKDVLIKLKDNLTKEYNIKIEVSKDQRIGLSSGLFNK